MKKFEIGKVYKSTTYESYGKIVTFYKVTKRTPKTAVLSEMYIAEYWYSNGLWLHKGEYAYNTKIKAFTNTEIAVNKAAGLYIGAEREATTEDLDNINLILNKKIEINNLSDFTDMFLNK